MLTICAALFVISFVIVMVNLIAEPGIDYWDLDGSNPPEASKLDIFRGPWISGIALAVLLLSGLAGIALR